VRKGRAISRLLLSSALIVLNLATPSNAAACSSEIPSYAVIANGARAIALLGVVASRGDPIDPSQYEVKVLRLIKGSLAPNLTVDTPVISACGDRLAVRSGTTILLAIDVPVDGTIVNPYWELDATGRVVLATGPYEEGDQVDAVIDRLNMHRLPAEGSSASDELGEMPWWPIPALLAVVFGTFLVGGVLWRARMPRPG
jgi:hypothetical protein